MFRSTIYISGPPQNITLSCVLLKNDYLFCIYVFLLYISSEQTFAYLFAEFLLFSLVSFIFYFIYFAYIICICQVAQHVDSMVRKTLEIRYTTVPVLNIFK